MSVRNYVKKYHVVVEEQFQFRGPIDFLINTPQEFFKSETKKFEEQYPGVIDIELEFRPCDHSTDRDYYNETTCYHSEGGFFISGQRPMTPEEKEKQQVLDERERVRKEKYKVAETARKARQKKADDKRQLQIEERQRKQALAYLKKHPELVEEIEGP